MYKNGFLLAVMATIACAHHSRQDKNCFWIYPRSCG